MITGTMCPFSIAFLFHLDENDYMKVFLRIIFFIGMVIGFAGMIAGFCTDENLYVQEYTYSNQLIDSNLDGMKIVQLSDLHNHSLTYKNGHLIEMIQKQDPDIVVITGDLIDQYSKEYNIDNIRAIFDSIKDIPTYYITGNHEYYANMQSEFKTLLSSYSNITYLNDEKCKVEFNGSSFNLIGLHDPYLELKDTINAGPDKEIPIMEPYMKKIAETLDDEFTVCLSHRPSMMEMYKKYGMDLVLSGHTHGGQINVFPLFKYRSGLYKEDDTTMIVSNGLGSNGKLPVRVFCPMQLVSLTLKSQ